MSFSLIEDSPFVVCDNVTFSYSNSRKPVLSDISLSLMPKHIYGLLGKNGVGKSTLFRLISGLNPLSQGSIHTLGYVPFERKPSMLNSLYLVPEEIEFPGLTVSKYADVYGRFYPRFSHEDLNAYMEAFEMPQDYVLKEMSQGQRKKAVIAFALACHTPVLLMDEPTNGLDISSKTQFRRILSEFVTGESLVIISTHQVRDLEGLIDGVIIINENHRLGMCALADQIMDKMCFGEVTEELAEDKVIYKQRGVHKSEYGVWRRGKDVEKQSVEDMDLELLFNAVMTDGRLVRQIMDEEV